ncbi:MAG TPA: acyltransferase [Xanthomonadaceae bacterium]|nr:acyltransferase [Xanthomonadaceae bacterium]
MTAGWKARPEGGARWVNRMLVAIGRHGGRPLARAFLYPITLYFVLRRGPERRASKEWLSRALGRPATFHDAARHLHTFAATILDRMFLLADRDPGRFAIDVQGLDALHAAIDEGRGVLLFGSHLGSFEVLRVLKRARPEIPLRVVLDRGHNPALTELLEALDPEVASAVIDAGQPGPDIMLAIGEAVAGGAMVALLVDRVQPGAPAVAVPFLGREAPWPLAPWQLAAALQVPVVLAFGLYRGGNRYELVFEPFSAGIRLARAERARALPALIAGYVARLEHHARNAPFNWFNFYPFWDTDHAAAPLDPAPLDARHAGPLAGGKPLLRGDAVPGR